MKEDLDMEYVKREIAKDDIEVVSCQFFKIFKVLIFLMLILNLAGLFFVGSYTSFLIFFILNAFAGLVILFLLQYKSKIISKIMVNGGL